MNKVGKYELGKDIPEEEFYRWVQALRSGKYVQGKSNLFSETIVGGKFVPSFCCLGVLCKEVGNISEDRLEGVGLPEELDGYRHGNKDKWFRLITEDFGKKLERTVERRSHVTVESEILPDHIEYFSMGLRDLNDDLGMSFDEIADVLELVYVHKALE